MKSIVRKSVINLLDVIVPIIDTSCTVSLLEVIGGDIAISNRLKTVSVLTDFINKNEALPIAVRCLLRLTTDPEESIADRARGAIINVRRQASLYLYCRRYLLIYILN